MGQRIPEKEIANFQFETMADLLLQKVNVKR